MKRSSVDVPILRRARDYHLFDQRGRRYLDMGLNGGRALLGHRPRGLGTVLKNQVSRGLLGEASSVYDARLEKVLRTYLGSLIRGNWTLRIYRSFDRALLAARLYLGRPLEEEEVQEAFLAKTAGGAVFLRPLAEADYSAFRLILPVLPFPGGFAPQAVFFIPPSETTKGLKTPEKSPGGTEDLPADASPPQSPLPGDQISPLLAAGLIHVLLELQKKELYPDIWKDWDLSGWRRFGPYCFPPGTEDYPEGNYPPAEYAETRSRFLRAGVIISPDPGRPSILPGIWSPGEKALVEQLFAGKI